jgi:PAS domain-containing protein
MQASPVTEDRILHLAIEAVQKGEDSLLSALDQLPAAIYVTDPDGIITYYNPACIDFAGRVPTVGSDRWCVTWKLYTDDGAFLPHDQCPMAVAILEKRSVRGVTAVAERPDGSRVNFMPYPTPIFDSEGKLLGAVNILVDVTDRRQAEFLRSQARRCRRLAISVCDQQTADTLTLMAAEYEQKADALCAASIRSA